MRILGAVRLSRDTDATTSPERQREQITLNCQIRGDSLVHTTEDVDVSGKVSPFDRPELGPWLTKPELIEQWDAIMVAKLDRLSRSMFDFMALLNWCRQNGKTVISVSESLDFSTPIGRMFAQLLAMFAEFQRGRIGERRAEAASKLRSEARWGGGRVPYGYQVFKNGHMILVPKPDEQAVILRAAGEIIKGRSVNAVVAGLNSEGIPSQGGNAWLSSTMIRLLRNPVIRGYVMHDGQIVRDDDGMPVRREALIDDEMWTQLQARLDANATPRSGAVSDANLLLQVAFCTCGQPLYGHARKGRGYGYYQCKTRRLGGKCETRSIRIDVLDELVTEALLGQVGSVAMLEKIVIPAEDHTKKLAQIEQQIADIEAEVVNGMPVSSATRMLAKLEANAEALRALPSRPERIEWKETGQTFSERWAELDRAGRHQLMLDSGFEVRVADAGRPKGLTFAFRLDPDLARRVRTVAANDGPLLDKPSHAEIQASWEAPGFERSFTSVAELASFLSSVAAD
jgi:site-specific DNA recombinase